MLASLFSPAVKEVDGGGGTSAVFGSQFLTERVVVRLYSSGEMYGGFDTTISHPPPPRFCHIPSLLKMSASSNRICELVDGERSRLETL